MALAEPFFFRVRDALFVPPPNRNTKHARFAGGALLVTRASPRPPRGKCIEILCFLHFTLARRAERKLLCTYNVFAFLSFAVLLGPLRIFYVLNAVSLLRGFAASEKEVKRERNKKNIISGGEEN